MPYISFSGTYGALFAAVVHHARDVVHADRASLFLVDEGARELWSTVADGDPRAGGEPGARIRVPLDAGLVGHAARTGEASC